MKPFVRRNVTVIGLLVIALLVYIVIGTQTYQYMNYRFAKHSRIIEANYKDDAYIGRMLSGITNIPTVDHNRRVFLIEDTVQIPGTVLATVLERPGSGVLIIDGNRLLEIKARMLEEPPPRGRENHDSDGVQLLKINKAPEGSGRQHGDSHTTPTNRAQSLSETSPKVRSETTRSAQSLAENKQQSLAGATTEAMVEDRTEPEVRTESSKPRGKDPRQTIKLLQSSPHPESLRNYTTVMKGQPLSGAGTLVLRNGNERNELVNAYYRQNSDRGKSTGIESVATTMGSEQVTRDSGPPELKLNSAGNGFVTVTASDREDIVHNENTRRFDENVDSTVVHTVDNTGGLSNMDGGKSDTAGRPAGGVSAAVNVTGPLVQLDPGHGTCPGNQQCNKGCPISVQGWSDAASVRAGYIDVDGVRVYNWTNTPGLYVAYIKPFSCRVQDVYKFDSARTAAGFIAFLEVLPASSIIVAVSGGRVARDLKASPEYFYKKLGVWLYPREDDIVAFYSAIGQPDVAEMVIRPRQVGLMRWTASIPIGDPFELVFHPYPYAELEKTYPTVQKGHWQPQDCDPGERIALIVPFRDRDSHFRIFLTNIISFLQRQNQAFSIYVIEQAQPEVFNRAALMNIGYLEASRRANYTCYVFHDVDLLPEDACHVYRCPRPGQGPEHLSVAVDKFSYQLPYETIFGGATLMTSEQVRRINGFPNVFFGWGGEDDNISARVRAAGYSIRRHPSTVARYRMLQHGRDESNPYSFRTEDESVRHIQYQKYDGLNSINYEVLNTTVDPLFTWINVQIPGPVRADEVSDYFNFATQIFENLLRKEKTNSSTVSSSTPTTQPPTQPPPVKVSKRVLPSVLKESKRNHGNAR